MQRAAVLQTLIRERGKQGKPLERVYQMLFNPELYLVAYAKLYRNDGAMTPGSDDETVDGMSGKKIEGIIEQLRHERYRWKPTRRVYIPKKNGKPRPLSVPSARDKLVQEVLRLILECLYDSPHGPYFYDTSHGFRSNRSCHTALREIRGKWPAINWFVEGDIQACFDHAS